MSGLTLQKQTKLHADGQTGNCMMTCYANYLGYRFEISMIGRGVSMA